MAKKKKNNMDLLVTIVITALAVVAVCTLFMPIIKTTSNISSSSSVIKGIDIISATFKGEADSDTTWGAARLILLKGADDTSFVTTLFCWTYFITVVASAAIVALNVLSLIGIRIKMLNTLAGAAAVLVGIVALILAFVVSGKLVNGGVLGLNVKTAVTIGGYLLLTSVVAGGTVVYFNRA